MSSALSFCPRRPLTCVSVRVTDRQMGGCRERATALCERFQPSVRDWDAPSSPVCAEGALLFQSRRIEGFSESPDNLAAAALKDVHAQVSVLIAWVCIHHSRERRLWEISLSHLFTEGCCGFCHPPPPNPILSCHFCLRLHVVGQWFTVTLAVITTDCCFLFFLFFFFRIAQKLKDNFFAPTTKTS